MGQRPTISDVAATAGVSVATVDRVLNARAPVRAETARRVQEAAQSIGYHAAPLIDQRLSANLPEFRIGYVLHKERQPFYQALKEEAERSARETPGVRGSAVVEFSPSQSPGDFITRMEALADHVDAIAATAVTDPQVTDAVSRLQAGGVPCFALLNDFAQGVRKSYIGLHGLQMGRIAGHMVATAARKKGKLAVFVGGHRWLGHELRETGFRSYFRQHAPQFTILDTLVNLETRQLTYEATLDLLDRHPDLRGLYCAGGGMEGAIRAIREVREPGEVTLVVNELTQESRLALVDRYAALVIATPIEVLCRDLMSLARQAAEHPDPSLSGQHFLRPDLYLPESV